MKTKFKNIPRCEVCETEEATSFSCMKNGPKGEMTDWKFCGDCTSETEIYDIPIDAFFDSPRSTVDWLAHMHEKVGMDWKSYMDMIDRFRDATDSYGAM